MSRTLLCLVRSCMAPIWFPAKVGTFLYAAMIRSTLGANPVSNAISTGGYFLEINEAKATIGTHNDIWECVAFYTHCHYMSPWHVTSTQGKLDTRQIKPVLSATLMTNEQHPGNNTLPTQHLATKSRFFNDDRRQHCRLWRHGINLGLNLLPLNMDSWNFCLMKNLPEFLNLENPILLGRYLCRLVDSYGPFGRANCLHLQAQAVQELVPSGLNSRQFPAVWSPTFLPAVCSTLSALQSNTRPLLNASLGTVSRTTISFYFIF